MEHIIYKALFGKRKSKIVNASLAIIGLYLGFLIWYVIAHYLNESAEASMVLTSFMAMLIVSFIAIYQIPDFLCTNKRINDILNFPIRTQKIIGTAIIQIFLFQVLVIVFLIYPSIYFFHNAVFSAIKFSLLCVFYAICYDLYIFIFSVLLPYITPIKFAGYILVVLQYVGFLILSWIGVTFLTNILVTSIILNTILDIVSNNYAIIILLGFILIIVASILTYLIGEKLYISVYLKLKLFNQIPRKHSRKYCKISNPYILLEWYRVIRNKELIFYSNVKNIITVFVLANLIINGLKQVGFDLGYLINLFLMMSCCVVNTISSTAYSSDKNTPFYSFFPMRWDYIFHTKVMLSFMWNELIVIIIWIISCVVYHSPILYSGGLLIYGTVTNYICSWVGVYVDYNMPRKVNSTNELLHGNMAKVIVMAFISMLSIAEIYIAEKYLSIEPLIFATIINVVIMFLLVAITTQMKGEPYDKNK